MPVVEGLPMPVVRGHVAPGQPAAGSPEHSVDHCAVIGPAPTPWRSLTGQQRLQPGPFLVGQIMTIEHETGLPHPLIKIRGTRSSTDFRWPELVAVTDLASPRRALDTILEQGEGAGGRWETAHFGQFVEILEEY